MKTYFDIPTLVTIILTFVVFFLALLFKGITHDILLEIGVFLVSVKLILMTYQNSVSNRKISRNLDEIRARIKEDSQCLNRVGTHE